MIKPNSLKLKINSNFSKASTQKNFKQKVTKDLQLHQQQHTTVDNEKVLMVFGQTL